MLRAAISDDPLLLSISQVSAGVVGRGSQDRGGEISDFPNPKYPESSPAK